MKKITLTLSLTLFSCLLFAQQAVTVTVVDSKTGNPVPNATVKINSTGKGGSTNGDGVCKLSVGANSVLEITSVGYATQLVTLKGQSAITVQLEAASVDLGDVVIVGTRGAPRAKTETAVPVDVIRINQAGLPTAKMDLTSVLNIDRKSVV